MSWTIFRGTFAKTLITMRRYLFNTLSGLFTMYLVFCLLFFGAQALGGAADMGDTLEGLVVGYFVWMLAIMAYSDLSWHLLNEAQVGTLEQMYLTPVGFHWVNAAYLVSNLMIQLVLLGGVLFLMIVTSGQQLVIDVFSMLPLLLLTVTGAYGAGFMMGGLALIYKRIQASFQILQFVFVAFLTVPLARYPLARFLPLAMGNSLLRRIMVDGQSLFELSGADVGIAFLTGMAYLVGGIVVFRHCEKVARRDGLLGQY